MGLLSRGLLRRSIIPPPGDVEDTSAFGCETSEKSWRQIQRSPIASRTFISDLYATDGLTVGLDGESLPAFWSGVSSTVEVVLSRVQSDNVITVLVVDTTSTQTGIVKSTSTSESSLGKGMSFIRRSSFKLFYRSKVSGFMLTSLVSQMRITENSG